MGVRFFFLFFSVVLHLHEKIMCLTDIYCVPCYWYSENYKYTLLLRVNNSVYRLWGVLVSLKLYWVPDIAKFILGRFSHFKIVIAYSNSKICGAWSPSFCEFTCNFGKTSTPLQLLFFLPIFYLVLFVFMYA